MTNMATSSMSCVLENDNCLASDSLVAPVWTVASPTEHVLASEELRRHCHNDFVEFDLRLAIRFVELVVAGARCPVAAKLLQHIHNPYSSDAAEAQKAMRPILRSFRLLHLCGFDTDSIEVIVAHAAVYLQDLLGTLHGADDHTMTLQELSFVTCLQLFLAHSWLEDVACSLKNWHKYVFAGYCSIKTLNAALVRLLEIRSYKLRVDEATVDARLSFIRDGAFLELFMDGL
eukprot:gnl/MRDRNA2_/MRDRNA2_75471_c0_seq1.p1 gnl/MRDRNA2_/MRDRNA2_75471_c0~~gnl/MRDRNA2_/MRDRNA2_75471_c0_seq1.p1  ORF type:complete len:231 (-),score=27.92 gnl/MRDRNA2_/MRDRNA2_75471_c0_seq1:223-915(-)